MEYCDEELCVERERIMVGLAILGAQECGQLLTVFGELVGALKEADRWAGIVQPQDSKAFLNIWMAASAVSWLPA